MTGQAVRWRPENSYWSAASPAHVKLNHWCVVVLSIRWREDAGWRWRAIVPGAKRGHRGAAPNLATAKTQGLDRLRALYGAHPEVLEAHIARLRARQRRGGA